MSKEGVLLWFRRDLRLRDNAALAAALEEGKVVWPCFIHDPDGEAAAAPGAAASVWLHHTLVALRNDLAQFGLPLYFRKGDSMGELRDLLGLTRAGGVYWNRCFLPPFQERDARIKRTLRGEGFLAKSFNSSLLFEPQRVSTGQGKPYQVFTPFWKTVSQRDPDPPVKVDLRALHRPQDPKGTGKLEDLGLLPKEDWPVSLISHWEAGEGAAMRRLDHFIESGMGAYAKARDMPGRDGTSLMSPFLAVGSVGPRQIWQKVKESGKAPTAGARAFLREVGWREFAYHVIHHFPDTPRQALREKYRNFPWQPDSELLNKWKQGQTGYPMVDAGMRQLWRTGWIHNRARMVVGSFLTKHLLQSWEKGAAWFWDTLIDADLANNTLGWQWVAGCGADAAPYFRVFNPFIQGEKFDGTGAYVRQYVPELADLPDEFLHRPWETPKAVLESAGVRLGETYPTPIIEHSKGRRRALEALSKVTE